MRTCNFNLPASAIQYPHSTYFATMHPLTCLLPLQETAQEHDSCWTVVLNWIATDATVSKANRGNAIQARICRLLVT